MCGLMIDPVTYYSLINNGEGFNYGQPLDISNLQALNVKVKRMNISEHSSGFTAKLKAIKRSGEESDRLYKQSISRFKKALDVCPFNRVTSRNIAECYLHFDERELAYHYFKRSLDSDPKDTNTLFKFAMYHEKFGSKLEAEKYYLKAIEQDQFHSNALTVYADFLYVERRKFIDAAYFYLMAICANSKNKFALNNLISLLVFLGNDKYINLIEACASRLYDLEFGQNQSQHCLTHLQNILSFYKSRKDEAQVKQLSDRVKIIKGQFSLDKISIIGESNGTKITKKRNMRRKILSEKKAKTPPNSPNSSVSFCEILI